MVLGSAEVLALVYKHRAYRPLLSSVFGDILARKIKRDKRISCPIKQPRRKTIMLGKEVELGCRFQNPDPSRHHEAKIPEKMTLLV